MNPYESLGKSFDLAFESIFGSIHPKEESEPDNNLCRSCQSQEWKCIKNKKLGEGWYKLFEQCQGCGMVRIREGDLT